MHTGGAVASLFFFYSGCYDGASSFAEWKFDGQSRVVDVDILLVGVACWPSVRRCEMWTNLSPCTDSISKTDRLPSQRGDSAQTSVPRDPLMLWHRGNDNDDDSFAMVTVDRKHILSCLAKRRALRIFSETEGSSVQQAKIPALKVRKTTNNNKNTFFFFFLAPSQRCHAFHEPPRKLSRQTETIRDTVIDGTCWCRLPASHSF